MSNFENNATKNPQKMQQKKFKLKKKSEKAQKHLEIAKSCPERSHRFLRCQVFFLLTYVTITTVTTAIVTTAIVTPAIVNTAKKR